MMSWAFWTVKSSLLVADNNNSSWNAFGPWDQRLRTDPVTLPGALLPPWSSALLRALHSPHESTHSPLPHGLHQLSPLTTKASQSAQGSHSLAVSKVSRIFKSNWKAYTFWYRLVYIPSGIYVRQNLQWVNYRPFPAYYCLEQAASESQSHLSKEEQLQYL